MKLIIILLCLGLERSLNLSQYLFRFNWFNAYANKMREWGSKLKVTEGYVGVAWLLLPLLIAFGILCAILCLIGGVVMGWLLSLLVLIYCLGPQSFYQRVKAYFAEANTNQPEAAEKNLKALMPTSEEKDLGFRSVTKLIMFLFNQSIFAVLFWFIVLGPWGALLYRVIALINEYADQENHKASSMAKPAQFFLDLLDWIPVRILGLIYCLVGNFAPTFNYWVSQLLTGVSKTHEIGIDSALKALHVSEDESAADLKENQEAFALTDRTLIVYLVILALVCLGSIIS